MSFMKNVSSAAKPPFVFFCGSLSCFRQHYVFTRQFVSRSLRLQVIVHPRIHLHQVSLLPSLSCHLTQVFFFFYVSLCSLYKYRVLAVFRLLVSVPLFGGSDEQIVHEKFALWKSDAFFVREWTTRPSEETHRDIWIYTSFIFITSCQEVKHFVRDTIVH